MRQIFVQETPGGAAQGAASHESQGQVQQQLEERQGPRPETPGSHRQCPARLPAQGFRHDQPKPRARGAGRPAGRQHVALGQRQCRAARPPHPAEIRPQPLDPRPGLVRVPAPARLQAGLARGASGRCATAQHQPHLPRVRSCRRRESAQPGPVCLCRLRLRGQRRSCRRHQCIKGAARPDSLWRVWCGKAGSSRSPPQRLRDGSMPRLSAVGISGLQAGEDVKFHTNATRGDGWQSEWTVFFWGWWLAWSPFVGMFIARISRGRTFREFVMGVLLVPTVITVVWIGLFGGTALYHELFGVGGIVEAVDRDVATALFATIEAMGLGVAGQVVSLALVVLIATYLITSANAGTLVINTILSGGDPEPPTFHRILWGAVLGLLTAVLLMAGGLETLQAAVIMAALPFSLVIMLMIAGLLKALHRERYAARTGERAEAPREPWVDLEDAGVEPVPVSDDESHKAH